MYDHDDFDDNWFQIRYHWIKITIEIVLMDSVNRLQIIWSTLFDKKLVYKKPDTQALPELKKKTAECGVKEIKTRK